MKIKWNDDRVRGAATAVLLIARDRLGRGQTEDLIPAALAEYRDDPATYKENKAAWADAREAGSLKNPRDAAYYQRLVLAVDKLLQKVVQEKRQFNSLLELDNFLDASLGRVR